MNIVRKLQGIKNYTPEYEGNGDFVKSNKDKQSKLQESVSIEKTKLHQSSFQNNYVDAELRIRQIDKMISEATIKGAERQFIKRLSETFINALNVDKSFIDDNRSTIQNYFTCSLKESANDNIYGMMKDIMNNSEYLHSLVESCKKAGKKAADEIKDKSKDESLNLDEIFDQAVNATDDGDNDEDDDIEMDDAEVAGVVKEKVIKVIKDEEENGKKKQELIDDITSANNDFQENVKLIKNEHVEKNSLFNSIMISNYKGCIEAANEGKQLGNYGTLSESGEIQVDMDYVLFDTIMEYTRIELMNTIRATNYSAKQLREMAYNYAYAPKNKKK